MNLLCKVSFLLSSIFLTGNVLMADMADMDNDTHDTGSSKTIAAIAASDPQFSTLVAALTAAGLVDELKKAGPFTVFAPTNDAFAKLPAGVVESLLKPENIEKLKKILLSHVVGALVMAADVKTGDAETLAKTKIPLASENGKVMVGDANVTKADIKASNGVIHVIDAVIIP